MQYLLYLTNFKLSRHGQGIKLTALVYCHTYDTCPVFDVTIVKKFYELKTFDPKSQSTMFEEATVQIL